MSKSPYPLKRPASVKKAAAELAASGWYTLPPRLVHFLAAINRAMAFR